jgi:hypothetical protein
VLSNVWQQLHSFLLTFQAFGPCQLTNCMVKLAWPVELSYSQFLAPLLCMAHSFMRHLSTLDSIHVPRFWLWTLGVRHFSLVDCPPKDSKLSSKTARSWYHFCHLSVQFHYAVFFAYIRLREQEIRNLMWISECVAQNQKNRVHDSVVFIFWTPQNNIYGCTKGACFDDGRIACAHYKPRTYGHCPFTRRKSKTHVLFVFCSKIKAWLSDLLNKIVYLVKIMCILGQTSLPFSSFLAMYNEWLTSVIYQLVFSFMLSTYLYENGDILKILSNLQVTLSLP